MSDDTESQTLVEREGHLLILFHACGRVTHTVHKAGDYESEEKYVELTLASPFPAPARCHALPTAPCLFENSRFLYFVSTYHRLLLFARDDLHMKFTVTQRT